MISKCVSNSVDEESSSISHAAYDSSYAQSRIVVPLMIQCTIRCPNPSSFICLQSRCSVIESCSPDFPWSTPDGLVGTHTWRSTKWARMSNICKILSERENSAGVAWRVECEEIERQRTIARVNKSARWSLTELTVDVRFTRENCE